MKFTIVMAYYENPTMLREQLSRIRALPADLREDLELVVVDDGSPNHPAVHENAGVPFQIYRIGVDVRWNQDAARNIGVRHARTEFVLMTDIDHIVPEGTLRRIVESDEWQRDRAYSFGRATLSSMNPDVLVPYKPHPNTWFLAKKLFDRVGGYDERFAGYYGTDGDFKVRLLQKASKWVQLPDVIYRVPRETIPDASTTSYTRKEPFDRPTVYKIIGERKLESDPRPKRYRFPYERVA